jgi:hypothetical protein
MKDLKLKILLLKFNLIFIYMSQYKNSFINEFNKYCKKYTYTPFVLPKVDRIVVFGDIHGDYKLAVNLLIISKVAKIVKEIDDELNSESSNEKNYKIKKSKIYKMKWIGGKTHVVQVGDQVDRCREYGNLTCELPETTLHDENSDIKIMELFTDLHEQAVKQGGAVISLLGNHEINNSMGNLTYVSLKGLDGFKNYEDPTDTNIKFNSGKEGRLYAFKPGNEYATFMGCTRLASVIIGSNLFAHAGIVNELIKMENNKEKTFKLNYDSNYLNKDIFYFKDREDFENINIVIKRWLLGLVKQNDIHEIISSKYHEMSMFWNRILGMLKTNLPYERESCKNNIDKVLKLFRVENIIIGHTPQSMQDGLYINATCGNKVWRVDTASSSAFDRFDETYISTGNRLETRKFQYLVIENDTKYIVCFEDKCSPLN